MKTWAIKLSVVLLGAILLQTVTGCYAGRSGARIDTRPPAGPALGLEPGLKMYVKNWTIVESARAKPGKKVSAQVMKDVVVKGQVIIPGKSVLTGHVAEVQKQDQNHPEARLRIVFDSIQLRGRNVAFTGVLEKAWIESQAMEDIPECISTPLAPCPVSIGPSENPSPGDDLSFSRFIKDETGDGIVIVSQRNVYLGWLTRFKVKVISPFRQQ